LGAPRPQTASCKWCKAFSVTLRRASQGCRNNSSYRCAPSQRPPPKRGLLHGIQYWSGLSRVSSTADNSSQPRPTEYLSRSQVVLQSFSSAVPAQFGLHRPTFSLSNSPKRTAPSSWRLPASALARSNTEPNTSISLELTLSLRVISLRAVSLSRWSEDFRLRTSTRRSLFLRDSPHELFAPFSTSSRAGLPARVSTPASFRLHRWSGLDGLLPARPCRLLSSGGTLGVARTVTGTPSLLSQRRNFCHPPGLHPFSCFSRTHLTAFTRNVGLWLVPIPAGPKTSCSRNVFPPTTRDRPEGPSPAQHPGFGVFSTRPDRSRNRTWKGQNYL